MKCRENRFILNPNPHPPGRGSFRGHNFKVTKHHIKKGSEGGREGGREGRREDVKYAGAGKEKKGGQIKDG